MRSAHTEAAAAPDRGEAWTPPTEGDWLMPRAVCPYLEVGDARSLLRAGVPEVGEGQLFGYERGSDPEGGLYALHHGEGFEHGELDIGDVIARAGDAITVNVRTADDWDETNFEYIGCADAEQRLWFDSARAG